ncbi:MAG: hypothetical protein ACQETB_09840 [Halobacteriota archaeon]
MVDPLNATIVGSILLWVSGVGISIHLLYRIRDYRFTFLTLMLSLMALRQLFTLFGIVPAYSEVPGLVVNVLAVSVVFYVLQYTRQEDSIKTELRKTNRDLRESKTQL